ncbi:aminomethyl-transferring glycine dehydrogenase subunit GcvPA [Virgibacillus necropolis]|uniref:Glycine dehydrogenase (Aminomethyl-transferring) n=1 Tax=Virgibacillus necropolis TaxID=163877 RepID=A0A221MF95_9BACI|nr:aminomethyl-transferring glycine dehydrogenase subunit GcvPA [Virgibacillus necropolis]ASN06290.1 glycine dehydrogenase (aminomethyl-transferring) [Virgibacillus necropolis]
MAREENVSHPYIPNTVPEVQKEMLEEIGLENIDELYEGIPESLILKDKMNIPSSLTEFKLRKEIESSLNLNKNCDENTNFMGAGCWQHFVPAVCDEVNQRSEFLTAYAGEPYEDHGRIQALFEYQSLVAELVDMEVVNVPTFDWAQAASTSLRMACRITGRNEVLLPRTIDPDKLRIIKNYCSPDIVCEVVDYESSSGQLDMKDLKGKVSTNTAAVYFENPSFLGFIEEKGDEISKLCHELGALSIVGVDPSSLGVIETPSQYGADIVCGDLQPLGMHMNYGGGQAGFIATRDEEKYVQEYPSRLFGIVPTEVEGEYGFGDITFERTSLYDRLNGKESVGTQTALWGITAGVYLSLLGPNGMYELGQTILQNSQYAQEQLSKLKGVTSSRFNSLNFKEFVIDFNGTGKSVEEIHQHLLKEGIFAGMDLSESFPELGQSALYCVTEVHSKNDIDKLVKAIQDVVE